MDFDQNDYISKEKLRENMEKRFEKEKAEAQKDHALKIFLYCTLTLFVTLFFGELATKYKFGR